MINHFSPTLVRGPLLNPLPDGSVSFFADGAIVADGDRAATIRFVGDWNQLPAAWRDLPVRYQAHDSVFLPPFLDIHTHLPQHPIRGRFTEGIDGDPAEGRLLAGLRRNVFPEEARHADADYAACVFHAFHADALSHGVVGGAAYGTVHPGAARAALGILPPLWSVGLVLMDQNCPDYLRTNATTLDDDLTGLADDFGGRVIATDRFAVSVTTPLRRQAASRAESLGLRMQTHLNEQVAEKAFVERDLYPGYASYTDVYRRDGLLGQRAIVAHCIQMTPDEWRMLADAGAVVAHCPTSNTLLGSGTMPLDDVPDGVSYALGTDVGASPTCSMLAEMAQFLKVHDGRSTRATPEEALFRATLAPAQILGVADRVGTFAVGMPLSFIEIALPKGESPPQTASDAILAMLAAPPRGTRTSAALNSLAVHGLNDGPDLHFLAADVRETANRLANRVLCVVQNNEMVYRRGGTPA